MVASINRNIRNLQPYSIMFLAVKLILDHLFAVDLFKQTLITRHSVGGPFSGYDSTLGVVQTCSSGTGDVRVRDVAMTLSYDAMSLYARPSPHFGSWERAGLGGRSTFRLVESVSARNQ